MGLCAFAFTFSSVGIHQHKASDKKKDSAGKNGESRGRARKRLVLFLGVTALLLGASCWLAPSARAEELGSLFESSRLPALGGGEMKQVSSADAQRSGEDFISLDPGEKKTIALLEGPAEVERIWLTTKSRDDLFLRKLLLRAYWDGESDPSIDSPLGDFFGVGFSLYKQYTTPLLGMSSGGYYCYFPMPFERSARFEIINQGEAQIIKFYFQITYRRLDSLPPEDGYFHAKWRREETTKRGEPYTVLEARGKGKFVGCVLSLQGDPGGEPGFMEGDDKFYLDGAKKPSLQGTGIEDYFNSGWYFKEGEFAAATHGCTVLDKVGNRVSAYRFHISDAIPFENSLKMTFDHGEHNDRDADISSVAYWYQKEPHWDFSPMPEAAKRLPKPLPAAKPTPGVGISPLGAQNKPTAAPTQALPTGTAFWERYYEAGDLVLPFLAALVGLLGLGYVLRRVMKKHPKDE